MAAAGACAHCGLPAPAGERHCCFGCELAARIAEEARRDHGRLLATLNLSLVLTMVLMMLSLFLYAEDVYGVGAGGPDDLPWMRSAYRWLSGAVGSLVVVLAGPPIFGAAWARLRRFGLSMEALVAGGALAAFVLSWRNLLGGGALYFETAAVALVLTTLGRYLEATARAKASSLVAPAASAAAARVVVVDAGGARREVAPAEVVAGMRLVIEAEEVVPVDLELCSEAAEVDLAVLTGEPQPVLRRRGERIPSGAVVAAGTLEGVALGSAAASTAARLADLAASLLARPSRLQRLADRFAAALTPVVGVAAAATLAFWWHVGPADAALAHALAVVLAACPCTYGVATPLVHWLVLRRALAAGAVVRSPEALEALAAVRSVAFDKTGTLTRARPAVALQLAAGVSEAEVRALVAAVEASSRHPVGRALAAWAAPAPAAPLADRRYLAGEGMRAVDGGGRVVTLGRFADTASGPAASPPPDGPPWADAAVELRRDGRLLARFALGEDLRAEAPAAVAALASAGVTVSVLTGDDAARGARVAAALGTAVAAALSPEDKLRRVRGAGVAMVGDGLNDAAALAGASVGIAPRDAGGLAQGLASVNLLVDDLRLVPAVVALARRGMRTARRLLWASTAYNLVFVLLAAAGLLRPILAGLAMLLSSLVTLGFALSAGGDLSEAPC